MARCQSASSGRVCASAHLEPSIYFDLWGWFSTVFTPAGELITALRSPLSSAVSGTLMVDADAYKGDARLKRWYDMALAYNLTMVEKEPGEKPRKRSSKK